MKSPLYTVLLLEHARHPRYTTRLFAPTTSARVDNPLCGDLVELELGMNAGTVAQVFVQVRGCAVSVSAGSLAAEVFRGRTLTELAELSATWRAALECPSTVEPHLPQALEPTRELLKLRFRPSRRGCARLAWDALDLALAELRPFPALPLDPSAFVDRTHTILPIP